MTDTQPLVPSRADESEQVLRARFQALGYLYLPRYLDSEPCEALLEEFLGALGPHVQRTAPRAAPMLRSEPFFETDPLWDEVYPKLQQLESFHAFFHQPALLSLMHAILGSDPFVYPMKMARIATPGKIGYETPPHQDAHSHQGGDTMAGIWIALHDVRQGMGRLKLLAGSHRQGVRRVHQAEGVGGVQCEIFPGEEENWHVSDVQQGDVIIFHACCVHKAEPNTTAETVRLSVDSRFCDYGAPVFISNFEPHHGWRIDGLDWDAIYRDWQDGALRYYWRDYPNVARELVHG